MRKFDTNKTISPFADTWENEQLREQLHLASGLSGYPYVYLCLFPERGEQLLDFSYGFKNSREELQQLARVLHRQNPEKHCKVADLHADHRFRDLRILEQIPEVKCLLSYPLRMEASLHGILILLAHEPRTGVPAFEDYLPGILKNIDQTFQYRMLRSENARIKERVREAEDLGGLGYWELELKSQQLFWSRGVYQMCGVDRDSFEVSQDKFYELVHPDDREGILKQQEAIQRNERKTLDIEHRMVLPDGRTIWVHERGRLVRDPSGKPRTFKGTVQDITTSKLQQEAMENHTAFIEATLANLPIGVSVYRLHDRTTIMSNDRFYQITGWPKKANSDGLTFMTKLYPDPKRRAARMEAFQEALKDPDVGFREWKAQTITTGKGKEKIVDTRYVVLRDHQLILLFLADVTEIYRAKEDLTFINERYRLASLATSDVIWDSNLVKKEHFWGENYKKVFGYPAGSDLSHNFRDWENHVHPDDLGRVVKHLVATIAGNKRNWKDSYRYKHAKTGEYRRVEDQGYIIRNEDGEAVRMVGAMKDITEKFNREEQLRLFESALQNTSDGILITETARNAPPEKHKILYANKSLQRMTGYSRKELLGKPPTLFRGPRTDLEALDKLDADTHRMHSRTVDVVNYKKNGDEFWINLSVTPIVNEKGEVRHFLSIQREITLKKAEEDNRNLINRLAKDFSDKDNFRKLATRLSKSIGETLGARAVELWILDEFEMELTQEGSYVSDPSYKDLVDAVKEGTYKTNEKHFHAQVHQSRKPLAYRSIADSAHPIAREKTALKLGLNAAYGVPLYSGTTVMGVITIFYEDGAKNFSQVMQRRLQDCDLFIGAEIRRRQLNEQLAEILNSVPDIICILGREGFIKKVNPGMSKLLGYEEEALLDKPITSFLHPEDHFPSIPQLLKVSRQTAAPYFETRMRTQEGSFIWIAWTTSKPNPKKQLLVVGKDITSTREQRMEIEASNERFRLVSEATNDAIWEWDAAEDRLIWTEGFERLFGYKPDENYNFAEWEEKVHPEDINRVLSNATRVFDDENKENLRTEYRFRRADGSYAYVSENARIIRDQEGKLVSVVGALQDVTLSKQFEKDLLELNRELKRRNEQLESSNTELEHFAYVASHDLQEPLRMISGFLTQLEKKYNDKLDEKGKTYIHYAVDGSKRMRTIIRELLEYSRVGRVQDQKEEVRIADVLDEVNVVYRILLEQSKGKLVRPEKLPVVYGHKVLLFQLFQNLVDNALKYRKKEVPPRVEISYRDIGDYWEFSVADNGIGIDPSYFKRIFVIFQRLHQKDEYGGAGMGLTTAKKIVEGMGGSITVDSELGKGTTFTFTIRKERPD